MDTTKEELNLAMDEYKRCVAEIKMRQTLVKAALGTLHECKDAMAELAIRLTAAQQKVKELGGKEDTYDGAEKEQNGTV